RRRRRGPGPLPPRPRLDGARARCLRRADRHRRLRPRHCDSDSRSGFVNDQAPAKTLTTWRYLGYGAGDVANNLTFSLASAFLLIYYTDVAGLAAGTRAESVC